jgi:hypothetical protein
MIFFAKPGVRLHRLRIELRDILFERNVLAKNIETIKEQYKFYEHYIDGIGIPLDVFNFETI